MKFLSNINILKDLIFISSLIYNIYSNYRQTEVLNEKISYLVQSANELTLKIQTLENQKSLVLSKVLETKSKYEPWVYGIDNESLLYFGAIVLGVLVVTILGANYFGSTSGNNDSITSNSLNESLFTRSQNVSFGNESLITGDQNILSSLIEAKKRFAVKNDDIIIVKFNLEIMKWEQKDLSQMSINSSNIVEISNFDQLATINSNHAVNPYFECTWEEAGKMSASLNELWKA